MTLGYVEAAYSPSLHSGHGPLPAGRRVATVSMGTVVEKRSVVWMDWVDRGRSAAVWTVGRVM